MNKAPAPPLPPLALVEIILSREDTHIASLSHVTTLISDYLDVSMLITLPQAAIHESSRLFNRVLTRVMNDATIDPALRSHWLAQAIEAAIRKNDLTRVQQIHQSYPGPLYARSLQLALQYGSLALVEWIIENRQDRQCCEPGNHRRCKACLKSSLPRYFEGPHPEENVAWLLDAGVDLPNSYAAPRHVAILQWLQSNGFLESFDLSAQLFNVLMSERTEDIEVLRFLLDHGAMLPMAKVIGCLNVIACQSSANQITEFVLASQLCDSFRDKFTWAPYRPGGAKVLQWDAKFMAEAQTYNMMTIQENMRHFAAQYCHVDTLMWLWHEHQVLPSNTVGRKPDHENDLLALYQWMVENDVDGWSGDDPMCAARCGYLSVIQWLHEHKPTQLTARTMGEAAKHGHLHVVQWLHANRDDGCAPTALHGSAINGHLDMVQWLVTNKHEGNVPDAMNYAAVGGHLDVVVWLYENSVDVCTACVLNGLLRDIGILDRALDTIRWLTTHQTRARNCTGACVFAQEDEFMFMTVPVAVLCCGEVEFARFLFEHHRSTFVVEPIERVISGGHLGAIQWLYASARETVNWQRALQTAHNVSTTEILQWLERVVETSA